MNKTRLGIGFALITVALIVGVTLTYGYANASMAVGKNGGTAGNGGNGGFIRNNSSSNATDLNGAPGKDANGISTNSEK
jgi:hypothetical protein